MPGESRGINTIGARTYADAPRGNRPQKDIAMRMQQFFDTKLKGFPAPDWMVRGIPYLAKGRDQLAQPAPNR